MRERHPYSVPPGLRFGVENVAIGGGKAFRSRLYVDLTAELYRRALAEFRPSRMNQVKRDGVIRVQRPTDPNPRLILETQARTGQAAGPPAVERARHIIQLVNLLDKVAFLEEKDPLLMVLMGILPKASTTSSYSMLAKLSLPKDADVGRAAASATEHMRRTAWAMEYMPPSDQLGVTVAGNVPVAITLGSAPSRGLTTQGWKESGRPEWNVSQFVDNGITSYEQEVVAFAGLVGVVHAVRQEQEF